MKRQAGILLLCVMLFASCASGVSNNGATSSGASISAPGTPFTPTPLPSPRAGNQQNLLATEQLLLMTPHTTLDLYSLAQRLTLHRSIPRVGRTIPLNAHTGQVDSFWVFNTDTGSYQRIKAQLVSITPHLYMYVEQGQSVNMAALQASANGFETKVYALTRAYFGSEWTPGIDDDAHITVLNTISMGTGSDGAFSAYDEYPTSVYSFSNERELIYMNLNGLIPGTSEYDGTLAVEFQRLINWNQRPGDQAWIDAGMSILAQQLNGYSTGSFDAAFLQAPDASLTNWSNDPATAAAHYGASHLFMDYFAAHYGGYGILKQLLQDKAPPPQNFNDVLAKNGYSGTFYDVLHNWFIANYAQNTSISQGMYGNANLSLPVLTPQHMLSGFPFSEKDTVSQNGAEYYLLPTPGRRGALRITLQGTPVVRMINNVPFNAANEWWSNSYDFMDSTLTRGLDLTHVKGQPVTLQFAAWYDLAQGSYTFVEVSTDNKNWTALRNQDMAAAPWGYGFSGTSGGLPTPQWMQESVDLSRYAGKHIWLRFETITGQAGNHQGFAIDDIRVPAIHFADSAATDNEWTSSGFVRSNNLLPEHFTVQALLYRGSQFTVSAMQVDPASGQGQLTIAGYGPSITRVIVIVSANAAQTFLPATYQLTISFT